MNAYMYQHHAKSHLIPLVALKKSLNNFFAILHLFTMKKISICESPSHLLRMKKDELCHHIRYPRTSSMCVHIIKKRVRRNEKKIHRRRANEKMHNSMLWGFTSKKKMSQWWLWGMRNLS